MKNIYSFFKNTSIEQEYNKNINISEGYPNEWLEIHYKMYPRFPQINLGKFKPQNLLEKKILERRSFREYNKDFKIDTKTLSQLLYITNKVKNRDDDSISSRRAYPSAGARFPIEQYIVIFNSSDLNRGLYHYNAYTHTLELVMEDDSREFFKEICNSDWVKDASALLILSCIPMRTCVKYNKRGLRYILFEVGHISQNIMLMCESLGLHTCAIGGFDDKKLRKYMRCEKTNEYPLYLITIGQ